MSAARVVLVTHPADGAAAFARSLVEAGLVACANRLPVQSVYRWKGSVEEAEEVLLILKTSAERMVELERVVRATHPYDVPEFVVLEPNHVEHRYQAWIQAETRH